MEMNIMENKQKFVKAVMYIVQKIKCQVTWKKKNICAEFEKNLTLQMMKDGSSQN